MDGIQKVKAIAETVTASDFCTTLPDYLAGRTHAPRDAFVTARPTKARRSAPRRTPCRAPRARARGRHRRRVATRSTARSGDSGDPGEPAGLALARDLIAAGLSTGEAARVVADAEYMIEDAAAVARLLRDRAVALESLAADHRAAAEAVAA